MSQNDSAPPVTADLLSWLERTFPNALPMASQTDLALINVKIGEQRVVAKLRQVHNQQRDNALSGTPS